MTFGFDTAVQIATEAIDRLHTTAESHKRVMVVEVMGRHAGWIALHSGLAGGADVILIPERPFDIDDVCRLIERRHDRGRLLDRGGRGGGDSQGGHDGAAGGRARRVRARPPGRDRAFRRDQAAHRLRPARPFSATSARRHCRPPSRRPRHPPRHRLPSTPATTAAGASCPRSAARASSSCPSRRRWRSCGRSRPRNTRWPRPFSAQRSGGPSSVPAAASRPSGWFANGANERAVATVIGERHRRQEGVERLDPGRLER